MRAFVEHLAGVVRAGPDCTIYGKPWEIAAAYSSVDGKTATVKALRSDGELTVGHAKAIIRALKDIGLKATWERIK